MGDEINTFNEKDLSLCELCVKAGLNFLNASKLSFRNGPQ